MIITRFMAIALICCMVIPNVYAGVGVERGLFSKGRFILHFTPAMRAPGTKTMS